MFVCSRKQSSREEELEGHDRDELADETGFWEMGQEDI